jgi:hypothetical protein
MKRRQVADVIGVSGEDSGALCRQVALLVLYMHFFSLNKRVNSPKY